MIVKTVEYVADYIERINRVLGLSMKFKYIIEDKGKYPLRRKAEDIVIVPEFFNHEGLTDSQRKMMIALFYSVLYLERTRKVHPVDPEHLAKGICDTLGEEYIPFYKIEETLRSIRIGLYDEPEYASFFSIGDEIRVSCCSRYRVLDVKKEKERKLASLQESRNNELKTALNPAIESVEPKDEVKEEKVDNVDPIINTEINVLDEPIINETETNNLEIPKIEPEIDIPVVNEENTIQNTENQIKEDPMIGLDSILSSNDDIVMPKLTNIETDKIEMPKVEEKRVKVIFSKDVPDVAVKEILSSSTVMPNVYSYLGNNIISNGGILL